MHSSLFLRCKKGIEAPRRSPLPGRVCFSGLAKTRHWPNKYEIDDSLSSARKSFPNQGQIEIQLSRHDALTGPSKRFRFCARFAPIKKNSI
jgi:hypothetical protein